jgi:hypothetical protein
MRLVFVELKGGVDGLRTRRTPVRPLRGPIRLRFGDGETNPEGAAE